MNRKRYEHKVMNLRRAIREQTPVYSVKLGEAMRHTHYYDFTESLKEYGSYKKMWDALKDIRDAYGVN